jgi:fructan beta-fructosidase
VGDFDGKSFTTNQKEPKWIDQGTDNYAGVTYDNAPNNKRIFIGWMSNWDYARNTPTIHWRSAMTLPRELSLVKIKGDFVLKSNVVEQLKKQSIPQFSKEQIVLQPKQKVAVDYEILNQSEIQFKAKSKNLKLVFSNVVKDSLVIDYDAKSKTVSIDRRHSGIVNFEESFGNKIHKTEVKKLVSETTDFRIFLDWSSIEVFLDEGIYSFTEQIFPTQPYTKLSIQSDESQEISNLEINKIKGIW